MGDDDSTNYEEMIVTLQEECTKKKKKRCMATIQDLTAATFTSRRKWILEEQPRVSDVVERFPSLKFRKIVSIS